MKFSETIVAMVLGIALSFNIGGNMSCNAAGQYDYFQFVQESPFIFCKNIKGNGCNILPLARIFTIHGLWPSNFIHRHKPCVGAQFSRDVVYLSYINTHIENNACSFCYVSRVLFSLLLVFVFWCFFGMNARNDI